MALDSVLIKESLALANTSYNIKSGGVKAGANSTTKCSERS